MGTESWRIADVPRKGIRFRYPPDWAMEDQGEYALLLKSPRSQPDYVEISNSNARLKPLQQLYQENVGQSLQSFAMDYRDVNSTPGSRPQVKQDTSNGKNFIRIEGTSRRPPGPDQIRNYELRYVMLIQNRFCQFRYNALNTTYQQSLPIIEQMFKTVEFFPPVST